MQSMQVFRAGPLFLFRVLQEQERRKLFLDSSALFSILLLQECRPKEDLMYKSMGQSWTLRANVHTG
uniref:Uncharacterized protein n=1 Tax=Arundo donax TaxID=35708 RepID=A0A0A9DJ39_ARUDO